MNESINIALTKSQVTNLVEFFDMAFPRMIADLVNGGELDNMAYLTDMCEVYTRLSETMKEAQNETD